ncbi:MAG TPA: Gfo/Idh/MocA family oxidoreductase, partial [Nocardioidaceae bacterium]|nr:Gfo/Idh/MocA family oxidoreductase [Nocardioidaceae bacterium]
AQWSAVTASILTDLPEIQTTPGPRRAEPLPSDRPVRWGIMATGKIARGFATNLRLLPEAEIAAVASRRAESAQAFAAEFGAARAYGSYEELVADPAIDVVYVATPHALHHENVLLAFEAGKPVLCEKALTLNAREAEELVAVARDKGLFLMEAMWMRCNPVIRRVQQLLDSGRLGTVHQVRADLGFLVDRPDSDRLLAPELGGGALLDMGVYPLTFAHLFLGDPQKVHAVATMSPSGIDLNLSLSLGYASGAVASLSSTMTAWSPRTASIATDQGRIDLDEGFHHPRSATWVSNGDTETFSEELIGTGLANEALEVTRCLRNGETESPLVPLDDTLAIMRLMDRIRADIGLRYAVDEV